MNNKELTQLMELDLGLDIINRRPFANEVFKWQDLNLLPHSSADTLLGEIYDLDMGNYRTTGNNLIGFLFSGEELASMKQKIMDVPRHNALIPDFQFTKDNVISAGLALPTLFNIGIKGNIKNAKDFSINVNGVTKSRITNIDTPGIEILKNYSEFQRNKTDVYRRNIKRNYIATSLFYAESVEVNLEKESGVDVGLSFNTTNLDVEAKVDTDTKKQFVIKYKSNLAPFAAKFTKGKDFDIM